MNPVVRQSVDDWEVLRVEQRGAAAKNWLLEDGGSRTDPQSEWLFKPVHTHANGTRQVGDWTEVIASLVAARLRLPSAEARLASRDGEEGVLVRNVRPLGYEMHSGTLALLDRGIEPGAKFTTGPRRSVTPSITSSSRSTGCVRRHQPPHGVGARRRTCSRPSCSWIHSSPTGTVMKRTGPSCVASHRWTTRWRPHTTWKTRSGSSCETSIASDIFLMGVGLTLATDWRSASTATGEIR